jgi:hypothetical protein
VKADETGGLLDRTRHISIEQLGARVQAPDLDIVDLVNRCSGTTQSSRYHERIDHGTGHYFFKLESKPISLGWWMKKTLARRSFECFKALHLKAPQFRTPVQYTIWERYQLGFARSWAILTDYISDTISIHDFLIGKPSQSKIESVAQQLGDHIGRLHRVGFVSRAIDETNILLRMDSGVPELWVIDLEHCKPEKKCPLGVLNDLECAMMLLGHVCALDSHIWKSFFFRAYNKTAGEPLNPEQQHDLLARVALGFQQKWGQPLGS